MEFNKDIDKILKSHNLSDDYKDDINKIVDKVKQAIKEYDAKYTGFINPEISDIALKVIGNVEGFNISCSGGYEGAEYRMISISPDGIKPEYPIESLKITYNKKFTTLSHRDVLGSVLSTGIKREYIGDIIIEDNAIYMFVCKDMLDFLLLNFEKIKRASIKIEVLDEELNLLNEEGIITNKTVSSLRLDNVIATAFNMSRNSASDFIKSEKVKVNYKVVKQTSKEIQEEDMISVRGKGRVVLRSVNGISKKDKDKVTLEIFK